MYNIYQHHEQLEDELYKEEDDDSEGSEADSELEFHLYSQLHYSSNAGEVSELEGNDEEMDEISTQDDHNKTDVDKLGHLLENKTTAAKKNEEKKKTKCVKKKKDNPKSKSASSLHHLPLSLEEVIVIDSGPDVITISEDDNSDETEGVCALKGRRLSKICTSTPTQQVKKKVTNAAVPVNLSSSSSESDTESRCVLDSSSSSDSDDLENWMILDHGQQDGDQSISLNLDGVAESETDIEELDSKWLVSDKDRQAQIFNRPKGVQAIVQRVRSRYYTDKNVQCRNCNKTGHLSKNCPEPKKVSPCLLCGTGGHVLSTCPYKHCHNCGLPGHLFNSCSERAYWHKQCHRCGMTGHFHDDCPEVWRQYHITIKMGPPAIHKGNRLGRTPAYCYNCAQRGHFGHECGKRRMFNGTFPSMPFINHYDTIDDIKFRQKRVKNKVKDLKNVCFISEVRQSSSTPGPPRKKQKTSLEKSNYRHKESAHQSYKTNLPASSHIFFSDTSDSISKTSKEQKHKPVSVEKPWKPKRPVPQSRDSLPKAKIVLDEADDFPRGGGEGEERERKKKNKKMKKNGQSLCWTEGFFPKQAKDKRVNQRKRKKGKKANTNISDEMYPTDENLFIIKQRKYKR